jgi:hypothetical protein
MVSMPSVSATVATASVSSRATKNTSTMPNKRLHRHLEDHGNREQEHGAADGAFGEIAVGSDQRVMDIAPDLAARALRRG